MFVCQAKDINYFNHNVHVFVIYKQFSMFSFYVGICNFIFIFFFAFSSIKTIILMNNNLVLLEINTTIDKTLKNYIKKCI